MNILFFSSSFLKQDDQARSWSVWQTLAKRRLVKCSMLFPSWGPVSCNVSGRHTPTRRLVTQSKACGRLVCNPIRHTHFLAVDCRHGVGLMIHRHTVLTHVLCLTIVPPTINPIAAMGPAVANGKRVRNESVPPTMSGRPPFFLFAQSLLIVVLYSYACAV